jgi:hypothetical protein
VQLKNTVFLNKNGLLALARRVELATTFLCKSNHGLETIEKFQDTKLEDRKLGVVKRAWNNTDAGMMIDGEKVLPFWFDGNVLTLANIYQRNKHGALFRRRSSYQHLYCYTRVLQRPTCGLPVWCPETFRSSPSRDCFCTET